MLGMGASQNWSGLVILTEYIEGDCLFSGSNFLPPKNNKKCWEWCGALGLDVDDSNDMYAYTNMFVCKYLHTHVCI